jgi:hypothetical protein
MSKKHYEVLAHHIRMILNPDSRLMAAVSVASACYEMNKKFDHNRFYEACGIPPLNS